MKRIVWLMVAIVVLAYPVALTAQRGGGRGGRGGTGGGQPASPGTDTSVSGIEEAAAVQATDGQRAQYQAAAKSVEAARKLAETLPQSDVKTAVPPNYANQAEELKAAIDKATRANQEFLGGLNKIQISDLKGLIKKVSKAGGEVVAKWKAVDRELESAKVNSQKLSDSAGKLVQALANLRSQQQALASEMGVQG